MIEWLMALAAAAAAYRPRLHPDGAKCLNKALDENVWVLRQRTGVCSATPYTLLHKNQGPAMIRQNTRSTATILAATRQMPGKMPGFLQSSCTPA
jgi:hypothetical protein